MSNENSKTDTWLKAYHDRYDKNMSIKDIAKKYKVSENTVKSWRKRHWNSLKDAPHPKKKGAPFGNKNASGPPKNHNARKHGLFSKWLPEEVREIVGELESVNPLDILWDNITLQYAAILRAQKIMWVEGKDDMTKELIEDKIGSVSGEKYDVQYAWDKQETFMKAQTRAMSELRSMIKAYDELLHKDWDTASEEQKARIAQLKAQTSKLQQSDTDDTEYESDGFLEALNSSAKEDWEDEETKESTV